MICLWENVCADNPLSPSWFCPAVSFTRLCGLLMQLPAFPSTTTALHFSNKGNVVRLSSRSAVQPDLFTSGQKILGLLDRRASAAQHKPEVTGLGLNTSHLQKDHPHSSVICGKSTGSKAALPPQGSLQLLLQNRAGLLASLIPSSTPAAWVLSSSSQLS